MKSDKDLVGRLQVVAPGEQAEVANASVEGERRLSALAAELDRERWDLRNRIGELFQRAAVRLLGSGVAVGLAAFVRDDDWQAPLLVVAGGALLSAASSAVSAVRYRSLLRAKWDEELEHLVLRLATLRRGRLRTIDVAEHLRISTMEAERRLEALHGRALVSVDVDGQGAVVYVFPDRA